MNLCHSCRGTKEKKTLLAELNAILLESTERAAKYDKLIAAYRDEVRNIRDNSRSLEVERFIVKYYPTFTPGKDDITVKSATNSLTITDGNSASAFYPIGWETDAFATDEATHEVNQPYLELSCDSTVLTS
ncbi:Hypothetical protein, putative [Bodo saltans]|uniref:Uncharacterized protein n=1 Tax=Bodo saltans TaxID=75058 RepID=A0A0S4JNF2_BODSA|nr:Hypothetical protein, putative [Bodo saltans]|eukprot:CUG91743.1 Hypothetical protein, putative [Bodo saltans]